MCRDRGDIVRSMDRDSVVCRRDQLYGEVWAETVRIVARRYGISDVALAKVCLKLRVPLPGRDYWAQKRAGERVQRARLPKLPEGALSELAIGRRSNSLPVPGAVDAGARPFIGVRRSRPRTITIPDDLEKTHRLVRATAKALRRGMPDDGIVFPAGPNCLD